VGYFVNRVHGIGEQSKSAQVARSILFSIALLTVTLMLGMMVVFSDIVALMQGDLSFLGILYVIPWVILVLTSAAVVFTVLAWKDRYWHISGRLHYTLVSLAAVALVWFFFYWNLL
jgi:hypothetical protein